MVSRKSLASFLYTNITLISLGIIQHIIIESQTDIIRLWSVTFLVFICRNVMLMALIDYGVKHKPCIRSHLDVRESYQYEFSLNVMFATIIETFTFAFIRTFMLHSHEYVSILSNVKDIVIFVPLSFVFEIVFDFFHYWSHRMVHQKYLYTHIHKKHHKYLHPITIVTYYQDPVDLLLTNSIPSIFALILVPYFSPFQYSLMLIYKEYIEISGHCGKILYPTHSFSQFVWLPRVFNMQLHTEEHDLHHSNKKCNYSKRFSLWDKLFGTYLPHTTNDGKPSTHNMR